MAHAVVVRQGVSAGTIFQFDGDVCRATCAELAGAADLQGRGDGIQTQVVSDLVVLLVYQQVTQVDAVTLAEVNVKDDILPGIARSPFEQICTITPF